MCPRPRWLICSRASKNNKCQTFSAEEHNQLKGAMERDLQFLWNVSNQMVQDADLWKILPKHYKKCDHISNYLGHSRILIQWMTMFVSWNLKKKTFINSLFYGQAGKCLCCVLNTKFRINSLNTVMHCNMFTIRVRGNFLFAKKRKQPTQRYSLKWTIFVDVSNTLSTIVSRNSRVFHTNLWVLFWADPVVRWGNL